MGQGGAMLRGSIGLSAALAAVVAGFLALSAPTKSPSIAPLPLTARGSPGFGDILILGLIVVAALIAAIVLWRRRR